MKYGVKIFACALVSLLAAALVAVSLFAAATSAAGGPTLGGGDLPELPSAGGGAGNFEGRGDGGLSEPPTGDPSLGGENEGEITDGEIEIGGAEPELPFEGGGMKDMQGGMSPERGQEAVGRFGATALIPVIGGAVGGVLLGASLCLLVFFVLQKRKREPVFDEKEEMKG